MKKSSDLPWLLTWKVVFIFIFKKKKKLVNYEKEFLKKNHWTFQLYVIYFPQKSYEFTNKISRFFIHFACFNSMLYYRLSYGFRHSALKSAISYRTKQKALIFGTKIQSVSARLLFSSKTRACKLKKKFHKTLISFLKFLTYCNIFAILEHYVK